MTNNELIGIVIAATKGVTNAIIASGTIIILYNIEIIIF